ncbi:unnamed protein product, partial [Mesorhabditis belari]|uniref:Uncharacterized protein n=1 Tax=Mesorhabditis belari TaxID=2138241 RepID=A0AAF3EAU9_9BILA
MKKNVDEAELNWNSDSWPMIRAAIVAGCYPGIGFVKLGNKLKKIRTSTEPNAQLHASSSKYLDPYSIRSSVDPSSMPLPELESLSFSREAPPLSDHLIMTFLTVI